MPYVIQSTHKWTAKDGAPREMTSYFKGILRLGGIGFALEMDSLPGAKRYATRGGARIDLRKYFPARRGVVIIEIS